LILVKLLDCSRGKGKPIDIGQAEEFYCDMKDKYNVVLAGGLSGENVNDLKSKMKPCVNYSIDAQSQLHTNKKLDMEKVEKYLSEAVYF